MQRAPPASNPAGNFDLAGYAMPEETNKLLEQIVSELRAVKRELAAIHEEVTPFAEERRNVSRMQSPLMEWITSIWAATSAATSSANGAYHSLR